MTTENLNQVFEQFKAINDRMEAETKKYGEATQETKTMLEKLNSRLDEIEVSMKRTPVGGEAKDNNKAALEAKSAFSKWARKGELAPEERKALTVGDDTTGGYLAPAAYANEIIKTITEYSPIRQIARVMPLSNRSLQMPKRTGQFAAQWVAETGTRSETTGLTYGLDEIPAHELYALVDISLQNLEDSAFNLEAELAAEFAEQFAVAEGTAFLSGNKVGKPEGILINGSIDHTPSGDASVIKADGLIDLYYSLKDQYAKNANWVMKRATIGAIRKLKDAVTGTYMWQPALVNGQPSTLLGQPIVEAVDMPAVAGGAFPVLFGDFRKGYLIADRVQISVQRDPYTQATAGAVRFIARKRVGGQVLVAEAIKKLEIAAS